MEPPANPDPWDILEAIQDTPSGQPVVGDIWTAAEAAGIKPGTIRTWMSRGKVRPIMGDPGQEIFHVPTVCAIAEAGRKYRPADPAANSRGPHVRAA